MEKLTCPPKKNLATRLCSVLKQPRSTPLKVPQWVRLCVDGFSVTSNMASARRVLRGFCLVVPLQCPRGAL